MNDKNFTGQLSFTTTGDIVDDLKYRMDQSAERLVAFEPSEGYYVANSFGKDSGATMFMMDYAGVKYDSHYSITSVDPPELTAFGKKHYPDTLRHAPNLNMWDLIVKKRMPPTRVVRYCCDKLKEEGGSGRTVVTGVRWAESANRKNTRSPAELDVYGSKSKISKSERKKFYLLNDNEKARRMLEYCPTGHGKHVVNPIIDWTDSHVWLLHERYNIPYCKLYDQGYTRLGCMACPMSGQHGMVRDFLQWPYVFRKYLISYELMLRGRIADDLETNDWENGHDVMRWWLAMSVMDYMSFLIQMKAAMLKVAKPYWLFLCDPTISIV